MNNKNIIFSETGDVAFTLCACGCEMPLLTSSQKIGDSWYRENCIEELHIDYGAITA